MAEIYKPFTSDDVASTRTLLHESIPLTGTIVSGTYGDSNIKNYSHGMFQSVYDYPYLSSSSNHIFDITCGYSNTSVLSSSSNSQNDKKIAIYNQMAQVLAGHDVTGNIRQFDADGDLSNGEKHKNVFFLNFSRLLSKDEIKKGTFSMTVMTGAYAAPEDNGNMATITDTGADTSYKVNSPAGEYGILKRGETNVGLLYYQAGVAVLTASVMESAVATSKFAVLGDGVSGSLTGSTIQTCANGFRHHLQNLSFNNTTELNSTIYFCRVNHNEFNYSANPTYVNNGKIVVKNNTFDNPVSYITSVGLYSADNELLAVAKLSEPLKKDPTNEMILRVRLDY
jgi:hypothetical protein